MNLLLRLSDKTSDQMYIHHKGLLKDAHITPSLTEFSKAYCDEYEHQLKVKGAEFPLLEIE